MEKKKSSGKVSGFFGTVIVCFVYFCHMASSLSQEEEKKKLDLFLAQIIIAKIK